MDRLRNGPETTGALSRALPELTRFAVMQHLNVLEEAGLVLARREGRQRFNFLNPAPIQELYERWMRSHAAIAAETAQHLKRYAESTNEVAQKVDQMQYRHVTIEMEMIIKAPRDRVFAALTEEYGNWWPHRYKADSEVFFESKIGGKVGEKFVNGGGAIYGEVVYLDPGHLVILSGGSSLNRGCHGYTREEVEDHPDGTLFKRTGHIWGTVPEEVEKMYRDGTRELMEVALRNYLEKGERYEVPEGEQS